MRILIPLLLALPLLSGVFVAPAFSQSQEKPTLVKSAKADLNGDGKPEAVTIQIRGASPSKGSEPVSFTLTVGGAKVAGRFNKYMEGCEGFRIVQIDAKSRVKQIAVVGWESNDFFQTFLYEFNGKALSLIGTLDADPDVSGNNNLYIRRHMAFWWQTEKYVQNAKTRQLAVMAQPAYYVGITARAGESFNIRYAHDTTSAIVGVVAPDSEIQLVLYWRGPGPRKGLAGQENDWYLIKTAKGLIGWARFGAFHTKVSGLPFAG